jgi:hypothetical protein
MIATPSAVRTKRETSPRMVNVGVTERWANIALGTGLIVAGAVGRSWGGVVLAFGGGVLLYRGISGQCSLYRALGVQENLDPGLFGRWQEGDQGGGAHLPEEEPSVKDADLVGEASAESFPASDAPVWTSSSVGRGRINPIAEN